MPRTCPAGFADAGDTCTKPSYGRTAGASMVCGAGKTTDAGLCYDSCKASFGGVGPVCWSKCEGKYPLECGALCATNTDSCVANVYRGRMREIGDIVAGRWQAPR